MNLNIVLLASFLFFLSEIYLTLSRRSQKGSSKTRKDRRSLLLFWLVIPLGFFLGFSLAYHGYWQLPQLLIALFGLAVYVAGLCIRWIAILQLKREFTVDVAIAKGHQLKTDGIFQYLRHPSYLGLWLSCTGLAIAMNNPFSILVIAFPLFLAIHYRIRIEEAVLIKEFGIAYEEYKSKSSRMIPGIY